MSSFELGWLCCGLSRFRVCHLRNIGLSRRRLRCGLRHIWRSRGHRRLRYIWPRLGHRRLGYTWLSRGYRRLPYIWPSRGYGLWVHRWSQPGQSRAHYLHQFLLFFGSSSLVISLDELDDRCWSNIRVICKTIDSGGMSDIFFSKPMFRKEPRILLRICTKCRKTRVMYYFMHRLDPKKKNALCCIINLVTVVNLIWKCLYLHTELFS